MDLIDKIKLKITSIDVIEDPIFDLKFDEQLNVRGFITSSSFYTLDEEEIQTKIWDTLKKNLENDELSKILAIFIETPSERESRLYGNNSLKINQSNIWIHITKDLQRYWVFIDVTKIDSDNLSFFLIINAQTGFSKRLVFKYPKDVIEFMDLKPNEIYKELFNNSYNNAVSEIKMNLMKLHKELDNKGVSWNDNIYSYVYDSFELKQTSHRDLLFTEREIEMIKNGFKGIDGYSVNVLVEKAITKSEIINNLRAE